MQLLGRALSQMKIREIKQGALVTEQARRKFLRRSEE